MQPQSQSQPQQAELETKSVEILTIKKLMKERDEAKISSNYVKSDTLRDQLIKDYNIEIFDQKNGPSGWKYKDGRSKKLPNGLVIPDNLKVKRKRDNDNNNNDNVDDNVDDMKDLLKKKKILKDDYNGDVKSK